MEWIRIFKSAEEARDILSKRNPRLLIVRGKRICLASHEGEFFAVQDSCSHNGESLSKGKINYLGEIICPWHNYRFQLQSGQACESSCRDLVTYPIKTDVDGLFIGI